MGNAMVFLFAGYETTASMLQFLAYQLALNPKIQDRLIQEIDDVVGKVYIYISCPYLKIQNRYTCLYVYVSKCKHMISEVLIPHVKILDSDWSRAMD